MKCLGAFALLLLFGTLRLEAQTLDEQETLWRTEIARYCGAYPSKDHCDDGDSIIFAGLLCLSGEEIGCETVRASQDATGQWWRSPRRNPGNFGERNSFSRDQTLGVLMYLAKTRDRDAAIRWMDWIEDNKVCSVKNPLTGKCIITIHRVCTNGENEVCSMTPAIWGLTKRVWDHLGLGTTRPMRDFENADVGDLELATIDSVEPGYRLHLKAVATFLRLSMRESVTRSQIIADKLYRRQPMNPFFQILAEGPSETNLQRVLEFCPKHSDNMDFARHQWAWERDQNQEAWRQSMGWDCVFMANLMRSYREVLPEGYL